MSEIKVDTVAEKTSANGVTVDGLSIKDSKLVTSNSVVAGNITADAIDGTKIADNAIDSEHYTDASIDAAHLNADVITGATAETSIATDDLILLSDTSASGALKKMTRANFVSGLGGTSQVVFTKSSNATTIPDDTETVLSNNYSEQFKIGSSMGYSSNIWSFPSTGVYEIHGSFMATVYPGVDQNVGLISVRIQTTTDNSSYSTKGISDSNINGTRNGTATALGTFIIFDVTNISTHKVRLTSYKADDTSSATTVENINLIFRKIADT